MEPKNLAGNAKIYRPENISALEYSPISGNNICYLGSSVTHGFGGISFVDFITKRNNTGVIKEAVSGTTLAEVKEQSYVQRLKTIDKNASLDLFICQLSCNDAIISCPLGQVEPMGAAHDTKTICGAIEYIIEYAHKTWSCPVVFYTNTAFYKNELYASMVEKLNEMKLIYPYLHVIDFYNDKAFNAITEEERELYLEPDGIHPTWAGYLKWWTPKLEEILYKLLKK